jgi:hypothetical protein
MAQNQDFGASCYRGLSKLVKIFSLYPFVKVTHPVIGRNARVFMLAPLGGTFPDRSGTAPLRSREIECEEL